MAGALDEDTAKGLASGRETAGAMLSSAQSDLKRIFLWFLLGMLGTFFALRMYVWDFFKEELLFKQMDAATEAATSVVAVTPFDVILLQVKIGLIVGVIVAVPAFLWYSRAALRRRGFWPSEQIPRWKLVTIGVVIVVLFVAGFSYGFQVFFPIMFSFLANNAVQAGFSPTYSIVKWTQFIFLLTISFGLAAQLPLAMSGMALGGIVRYETFRDKWRYAIVGIFVFGALFSPPDPFTQIMWALPLIVLYGFSLGLTRFLVLSQRAGQVIPVSLVVRERWNVLAGTVLLAAAGTFGYLTRGGLEATNDILATVGSSRRFPTASEFGFFGLDSTVSAAIVAVVLAAVVGGIVLFYLRVKALERRAPEDSRVTRTSDATTTAPPTAASAGEPAEIDIDALSTPAVRAAPPEAFADLTEEEAVQHAERALEDDNAEKAELILDRFDEVEEMSLETDDTPEEGDTPEDSDPVTSTAAGVMDAFTEEETTEDDIGGYYYDLAFILDSLTSKAIWLVGTFLAVLAGTFIFLYSGGIKDIMDSFLGGMPSALAEQVNIVTLHPVEALIFEIKFATVLGAVAAIPLVLYFAWPSIEERGITTGDRRILLVWGGTLLVALIGGSLLGFFYIAPTIISWLALDALTSNMVIAYRINNFGWLVIFTTIGIGLLAEVPVTMWLFDRGGIVSYETMLKRWRVVVLGIFAAAGLFSPKGILTMFLLALPTSFAFAVGLASLAGWHFVFR
jgi:sec-independent protein translocase protein TatC